MLAGAALGTWLVVALLLLPRPKTAATAPQAAHRDSGAPFACTIGRLLTHYAAPAETPVLPG